MVKFKNDPHSLRSVSYKKWYLVQLDTRMHWKTDKQLKGDRLIDEA